MARPGATQHRKFLRLARTLGSEPLALGCLEFMWKACYENGDEYLGDALDVEAAAHWDGEQGKLCAALFAAGGDGNHGFIDELEDRPGHYRCHDLFDHAPTYVSRRLRKEVEREQKGTTIAELRATAGRKGAVVTNSKRRQAVSKRSANEQQNAATPAPAPAPGDAASSRSANDQQTVAPLPSEEKAPPGLDGLQYACGLLENLTIPQTPPLLHLVAESIRLLAKRDGIDEAAATDRMLQLARSARERGEQVNRFFFEDARWANKSEAKHREPTPPLITDSRKVIEQMRKAEEEMRRRNGVE